MNKINKGLTTGISLVVCTFAILLAISLIHSTYPVWLKTLSLIILLGILIVLIIAEVRKYRNT